MTFKELETQMAALLQEFSKSTGLGVHQIKIVGINPGSCKYFRIYYKMSNAPDMCVFNDVVLCTDAIGGYKN